MKIQNYTVVIIEVNSMFRAVLSNAVVVFLFIYYFFFGGGGGGFGGQGDSC